MSAMHLVSHVALYTALVSAMTNLPSPVCYLSSGNHAFARKVTSIKEAMKSMRAMRAIFFLRFLDLLIIGSRERKY